MENENNLQNLNTESISNLKTKYYDDFSYLVTNTQLKDIQIFIALQMILKRMLNGQKKQKLNKIDKTMKMMIQ